MHRLRTLIAFAVAAAISFAAPPAVADEGDTVEDHIRPGVGTYVSSGSKVTATIGSLYFPSTDVDDYVLRGYAGQVLSFSVVAPRGSDLKPAVQVIRPDGTLVLPSDGARFVPAPGPSLRPSSSVRFAYRLDQSGMWTIRVQGNYLGKLIVDDPATPLDNEGDDPSTETRETSYVSFDYDTGRTIGSYVLSVKYTALPRQNLRNVVPGASGRYRFEIPAMGGATVSARLNFRGGTPTFEGFFDTSSTALTGVIPNVRPGRYINFANVRIPADRAIGNYVMSFLPDPALASSKVSFTSSVRLPKSPPIVRSRLGSNEPAILEWDRRRGGRGTQIRIRASGLIDPSAVNGAITASLGRFEMGVSNVSHEGVGESAITTLLATVSNDLPEGTLGTFDLVVRSTRGQPAIEKDAFQVVSAPAPEAINPEVASAAGGFAVTISGTNFAPGSNKMEVGYRSLDVVGALPFYPNSAVTSTDTSLSYTFPIAGTTSLAAGRWAVLVRERETGLAAEVPLQTGLTLTTTAAINVITPSLVPVLGGDTVFVQGSNFKATDRVLLETGPDSGVFTDITSTQTTFVNANLHQFIAPARPKGRYHVRIQSGAYTSPIDDKRSFAYYTLTDFTPTMGLTDADGYDAWSTFLADMDADGDLDLFLSRRGAATASSTSLTRVFTNDGAGAFTDVTSSAMPLPRLGTNNQVVDDWRADRVWVADVDPPSNGAPGYPDLILVTDSDTFPPKDTASHVRILINQRRTGSADNTQRQFVERTTDFMPPLRAMSRLYGSSGANETDDWRGQDMWVGDLDQATVGPPEILITSDRVFENFYVSCTPYCASPYSSGYTYSFYWGGTRMFKWDPAARSGLGRYKFDSNFLPRRSGITVPIFNPPPGVTIPTCQPNECRGKFTPFVGQRLAVGFLDGDGRPDIAVLNRNEVRGTNSSATTTISSLQVAINRPNTGVGGDGKNTIDVTPVLTLMKDNDIDSFRGNAIAIGQTSYPDNNSLGTIAIAKSDPTGLSGTQSALRLIKFKTPVAPAAADFEVVTSGQLVQPASVNDRYHAAALAFVDVDIDGDSELVAVAPTPPGGNGSAFRLFRNEFRVSGGVTFGVLNLDSLRSLVTPLMRPAANDYLDGFALSIGDLNGPPTDPRRAVEFVITRATTSGMTAPHTRAISVDR